MTASTMIGRTRIGLAGGIVFLLLCAVATAQPADSRTSEGGHLPLVSIDPVGHPAADTIGLSGSLGGAVRLLPATALRVSLPTGEIPLSGFSIRGREVQEPTPDAERVRLPIGSGLDGSIGVELHPGSGVSLGVRYTAGGIGGGPIEVAPPLPTTRGTVAITLGITF